MGQAADDLVDLMAECSVDPYKFVLAAFPWGEKGAELERQSGPRAWQKEVLCEIRDRIASGQAREKAVKMAVASGHGIGKSALVSWLVLWAMATMENTRGVVTANTAGQLSTKTWPEISKWYRMLICKDWFTMTSVSIYSSDHKYEKTWRTDAVTWSTENLEAFAGLHNEGARILLVMDEASNIDDPVWEVAEGAMTDADTEIYWICFGNPTRATGRFRECFRKYGKWWWSRSVDSRTVDGTNKKQFAEWEEAHGIESDFFKVRVRGVFPESDDAQLIPLPWVKDATVREPHPIPSDPIIVGVDVARYGQDKSVIYVRRGNDAKTIPHKSFSGLSLMELADRVADTINALDPDAVMIDETGVGGGVVDRLRQMGHYVLGINFASKPPGTVEGVAVANMRAYIWMRMREWIRRTAALPDDRQLIDELVAPSSLYNNRNEILVESKDDMKGRGLPSPDIADALALTFASHVGERCPRGRSGPSRTRDDPKDAFYT